MEIFFYIQDGSITNKKAVAAGFANLKDGRYSLKIESKKKRTLPQNQYYWGCIVPLVKDGLRDAGYEDVRTNNDAHEIMKHLFLKKEITSGKNADTITIAGSTAELNTVGFNLFIEEIIQWGAQYLSIQIPYPNEQTAMFYNELETQ